MIIVFHVTIPPTTLCTLQSHLDCRGIHLECNVLCLKLISPIQKVDWKSSNNLILSQSFGFTPSNLFSKEWIIIILKYSNPAQYFNLMDSNFNIFNRLITKN